MTIEEIRAMLLNENKSIVVVICKQEKTSRENLFIKIIKSFVSNLEYNSQLPEYDRETGYPRRDPKQGKFYYDIFFSEAYVASTIDQCKDLYQQAIESCCIYDEHTSQLGPLLFEINCISEYIAVLQKDDSKTSSSPQLIQDLIDAGQVLDKKRDGKYELATSSAKDFICWCMQNGYQDIEPSFIKENIRISANIETLRKYKRDNKDLENPN